jgi:hypothetical protein
MTNCLFLNCVHTAKKEPVDKELLIDVRRCMCCCAPWYRDDTDDENKNKLNWIACCSDSGQRN